MTNVPPLSPNNSDARAKLTARELEEVKKDAGKRAKKVGNPVVQRGRVRDLNEPTESELYVYRQYCRGIRAAVIAKELSITERTVSNRVKRVARWMSGELVEDIRDIRAEHTDKLTDLYCRAIEAFEFSQKPTETTEDSEKNGTTKKLKTESGTPAFLAVASRILADIRRMWGADAVISNVSNDDTDRVAGLPREKAIAGMIAAMKKAITSPSAN